MVHICINQTDVGSRPHAEPMLMMMLVRGYAWVSDEMARVGPRDRYGLSGTQAPQPLRSEATRKVNEIKTGFFSRCLEEEAKGYN